MLWEETRQLQYLHKSKEMHLLQKEKEIHTLRQPKKKRKKDTDQNTTVKLMHITAQLDFGMMESSNQKI